MKIVFKLFYIRWHCHIVTISYGAEEINDEDDDHYHDDDGDDGEEEDDDNDDDNGDYYQYVNHYPFKTNLCRR